ncbi:MAG: vancomycin resistance histidine kinase VanS [Firmicutes bacterium]|nr:vancomycin resistance histidine kinase VanS [Bacillota bacterium]
MKRDKRQNFASGQVWRFLIYSLLWTVIFLIIAYVVTDVLVKQRITEFLYALLPEESYFWLADAWIFLGVTIYVIVELIIAARRILYCGRFAQQIQRDLTVLMTPEKDVSDYPERLKSTEVQLKDIQHSIFRSAQIAKEAEQRKNDLVIYLAHDLKTPLTSVVGYLSLLEELPELDTQTRAKYVGIALNKAYRLEQLIDELFEITRFNLQTVELSETHIDLTMMLYQISEEFYPAFSAKNLTLEQHIESGLKFKGDADKLARVFDNLLRNAISYSHAGTEVTLSAIQNDTHIRIGVRNSGDRIPTQKLKRLFEKFYRADPSRGTGSGGTGLGLAIAKQLVELHHGTIDVVSNDQYTEFTVLLDRNEL